MATENFDFDLSIDFSSSDAKAYEEKLNPSKETPVVIPISLDENGKPFFTIENYPLVEMDWHERILFNERTKNKKQITSTVVGRVKIVYDGAEYKAELTQPMHGAGFTHWKNFYEKEIALAKAVCYAEHLMKYGNYGQICPEKSKEYFTLSEVTVMKIQEAQRIKESVNLEL